MLVLRNYVFLDYSELFVSYRLSSVNVHISWRRISWWCYVILSLGAAIFYTERGNFF